MSEAVIDGGVSFSEFGKPRTGALITRAKKELGLTYVGGPETHVLSRLPQGEVHSRVFQPIEFQRPSKGEDRIFAGYVRQYPVIVVADGVSDVLLGNQVVSNISGKAAEEAVLGTLEVLNGSLVEGMSGLQVYDLLGEGFQNGSRRLKTKNVEGRTTLLTGFLYSPGDGELPVWYYGYVGNGSLLLASPERQIRGYTSFSEILSQNSLGETPTIGSDGSSVDPIIGSLAWKSQDFLVSSSDGLEGPREEIWKEEKLFLPQIVEDANPADANFSVRLANRFRPKRFSDDAVMGLIATQLRK